ncbi:4395_t:CDS:2, partial [Dentiscutata heterogama]
LMQSLKLSRHPLNVHLYLLPGVLTTISTALLLLGGISSVIKVIKKKPRQKSQIAFPEIEKTSWVINSKGEYVYKDTKCNP